MRAPLLKGQMWGAQELPREEQGDQGGRCPVPAQGGQEGVPTTSRLLLTPSPPQARPAHLPTPLPAASPPLHGVNQGPGVSGESTPSQTSTSCL